VVLVGETTAGPTEYGHLYFLKCVNNVGAYLAIAVKSVVNAMAEVLCKMTINKFADRGTVWFVNGDRGLLCKGHIETEINKQRQFSFHLLKLKNPANL
jgi:hypothetical protein